VQLVDRPNVARHEIQPLSVEQSRALLTAAKDHRLGALFSVALALGLRKGEALGLRWQDVDFDGASLVISGALQRIGGSLIRTETKNNASRRMLQVPAAALRVLRDIGYARWRNEWWPVRSGRIPASSSRRPSGHPSTRGTSYVTSLASWQPLASLT
jgi:integrase